MKPLPPKPENMDILEVKVFLSSDGDEILNGHLSLGLGTEYSKTLWDLDLGKPATDGHRLEFYQCGDGVGVYMHTLHAPTLPPVHMANIKPAYLTPEKVAWLQFAFGVWK